MMLMLALASGCSEATSTAEMPEVVDETVTLSSIHPTSGNSGTSIMVYGTNFANGMMVCFDSKCSAADVHNGTEAQVVVPAGRGVVDVTARGVNGTESTLAGAFTYMNESNEVGGASGGSTAVAVPKITQMAPASGLTGVEITILGDNLENVSQACFATTCVSPESVGKARITVKAPEGTGTVKLILLSEGTSLTAGYFSYVTSSGQSNEIDWCKLTGVTQQVESGGAVEVRAQVYEEGCTPNSTSKCPELVGEVGYISANSAKSSDIISYAWKKAERNSSFNSTESATHDEFKSSLTLADGEYNVAFRFSLDGSKWKYCDLNDSNDGFSIDNVGKTTVAPAGELENDQKVTRCRIMNDTTSYSIAPGEAAPVIYAQGYVEGCTNYRQHCSGLKAQIGYGSAYIADKDAIARLFTWEDASLNQEYDGSNGTSNEEFMASPAVSSEGTYSIVYRMSVDGGESWTYCDTTDDPYFDVADAVKLTVTGKTSGGGNNESGTGEASKKVEWCRIQTPGSIEMRVGGESEYIYGQVFVPGCTGTMTGCSEIKAQMGYGPGTAAPATYTYVDASRNPLAEAGNNDEYMATIKPTEVGDFMYVYRFSTDSGKTWTYCDYDDEVGFKQAKAGMLTVNDDTDKVGWCRVQSPQWQNVVVGEESEAVYGVVYVEGCTEGNGACSTLKAQLGYGTYDQEVETFTYVDATYNKMGPTDSNDEYMATIKATEPGVYEAIYRFSTDNGKTWKYCSFDDDKEFHPENTSILNVNTKPQGEKSYTCGIIEVSSSYTAKAGVTKDLYAQIWIPGCTTNSDVCNQVVGSTFHYTKAGVASDVLDWSTLSASSNQGFNFASETNDEYMVKVTLEEKGSYEYVFSFDIESESLGMSERVYCFAHWSELPGFGTAQIQ